MEEEALKEVKEAELLINNNFYRDARICVRRAMDLYPNLDNSFEMLVVCETLYYGDTKKSPKSEIDWYSILHLLPSAKDAEVKTQCEYLIKCVNSIKKKRFPGAIAALKLLNQAMSVLCDQAKSLPSDYKLKEFEFYEMPISSKERYLNWRSPASTSDATKNLNLFPEKKPRTDSVDCSYSVVEDEVYLSPELRKQKNLLFDVMPQHPHYVPLQKYSSKVREGMVLGLDLAFINVSEDIRKLVDPLSLLARLRGFTEQLLQLEEMGYNVEKLRERLNSLQRISERDGELWCKLQSCRDQLSRWEEIGNRAEEQSERLNDCERFFKRYGAFLSVEEEWRAKVIKFQAEIADLRSFFTELDARIGQSKVVIRSEIEILKKDSRGAVEEFAATARSMWK